MPPSINIVNPYIMATAAASTTKVRVRIAEFNEETCECTVTGDYEVWENDPNNAGGGLTLSVDDWLAGMGSGGQTHCAKVISLNHTGTAVGLTATEYTDCSDCNDNESLCEALGDICLLPYMLVKRRDGLLVKVKDLNVGDMIETPRGHTAVKSLVKDHPRSGYYSIEGELHITNDHPILIDGKLVLAEDYIGNKEYIEGRVDTVYVGTEDEVFNVYCGDNVYVVSGRYKDGDNNSAEPGSCCK